MARRTREVRRFRDELLDELLAGADPAQVFADGGLLDDLKKAVAERALDAEMDAHLEGERSGGNHRNGHNRKREGAPSRSQGRGPNPGQSPPGRTPPHGPRGRSGRTRPRRSSPPGSCRAPPARPPALRLAVLARDLPELGVGGGRTVLEPPAPVRPALAARPRAGDRLASCGGLGNGTRPAGRTRTPGPAGRPAWAPTWSPPRLEQLLAVLADRGLAMVVRANPPAELGLDGLRQLVARPALARLELRGGPRARAGQLLRVLALAHVFRLPSTASRARCGPTTPQAYYRLSKPI